MKISKEELLHIAKLSDLEIKENEIEEYLKNLEDILNYTETIDKIDVSKLDETIGATEDYNVFRKDEVKQFDNIDQMMENGPEVDRNMFKIPKVL
ncbi:MAG: Asp-tRNA(Asn)/Glu-tRNA(Gln) amidotransferase subunit GatC [Clostridiales bacterium]|jgi:aspartyl/glutamyl-tRNA(asn/gln) amidotransferase, C subunit|nr:Asp-tRNA(Asn)/Glu-tRNA(Gln) amidotransferase subunit GatC [Clostridiales bacterium]MBF0979120.1 Asp-tRNA(Asn)/Glu-tRNA(Gln) amidotransferase subunit GatC [Clostridiales bacterium]